MKKIIKNIFATSTSWANEQEGNNVNLVSVFARPLFPFEDYFDNWCAQMH